MLPAYVPVFTDASVADDKNRCLGLAWTDTMTTVSVGVEQLENAIQISATDH